jgi:enoyl-CoA hydratase/carnithine racemase
VATITLNRPRVLNALDLRCPPSWPSAAEAARRDDAVWVVACAARGGRSAPAWIAPALSRAASDEAFYRNWMRALNRLEDMDKLSVAVLHGYSIGGGLPARGGVRRAAGGRRRRPGLGATRTASSRRLRLCGWPHRGPGPRQGAHLLNDTSAPRPRWRWGLVNWCVPAAELDATLARVSRQACTPPAPPTATPSAAPRLLPSRSARDDRGRRAAQDGCMASWEIEEANRAWDEKRDPNFVPPPPDPDADGRRLHSRDRRLTKEFRASWREGRPPPRARGAIHALIGPNGAGKTTCFNLLTHFLAPTRGRIHYNGRDITGSSPADIARRGLVRSFQISAVFRISPCWRTCASRCSGTGARPSTSWRSDRVLEALTPARSSCSPPWGIADVPGTTAVELPYGRKRASRSRPRWRSSPRCCCSTSPPPAMATRT